MPQLDLSSIVDEWLDLDDSLDDRIVKTIIDWLEGWDKSNYSTSGYILFPGEYVYRARKASALKCNNYEDFGMPPAELSREGRANAAGKRVFYCSDSYEPTFFELGPVRTNELFVVSAWIVEKPIVLSMLGFNRATYRKLKYSTPKNIDDLIFNDNLNNALGILFACLSRYDITAKIFDHHVGERINSKAWSKLPNGIGFQLAETAIMAGVSYPSLRMAGRSKNYAIIPEVAEKSLRLVSAREYLISPLSKRYMLDANIKSTANIILNKNVAWERGSHNFVLDKPDLVRVIFEQGCDDWGWYIRGKGGIKGSWSAYDGAGRKIEPIISELDQ